MDPAVFQGLNPGGPEAEFGYAIPNVLIDHAMRNPPIPPGFWRGVNINHNAIYSECFMDELAYAAGQDPLEFRRKMLKPKHLAVLNAAAEKAGYGKAPAGVHQGLAQFMGYGSYVAAVAEVSVSKEGRLKIHRIVAATNPGHAVNPAQIERQVAGSFVYGLSAMMYGECTVSNGAIEQTNFDSYNVLRIDEMPKVETVIVPTGASSCSGCHSTGASVQTPVPRLIGRPAAEIVAAMQGFRTGQRPGTVMDRIAKGFSDAETATIAAWYATQKD